MKKVIVILFFAFISISGFAQYPSVQWQRSLGGSGLDAATEIQRTADSGYIAICYTNSYDGDVTDTFGDLDCWIVKLSPWGSIMWQKSYGGSGKDVGRAIQQTSDGGYIVACSSNSTDGEVTGNHGLQDYWILKLNDTGGIQWEKSYGGSRLDQPLAIEQTTDGGYIVGGWTQSSDSSGTIDGDVTYNHGPGGTEDYWVVKLNDTGGLEWQKTYGGSDDDFAVSIRQTTDGGFIVSGSTNSTDGDITGEHGGDDFWLVKLNSTGGLVWENTYGGSNDDDIGDDSYSGSVQQTFDKGYIVTGITESSDGEVTGYHGGTLYDYWVVKTDSVGNLVWEKTLGGTNDDDGYFVQQTADSGYVVCGASNSIDGDITRNLGTYDYWIVKLTNAGSIAWQRNYGGTLDEYAFCIQVTSDSEFIVAGYSASNDSNVTGNHGGYDAWILKLAYCSLPDGGSISGPTVVCEGSSIVLSDYIAGGTWSTGSSYGTISAGGMVSGVSAGIETILYSVSNSCGTGGASYVVTVSHPGPVITKTGDTLSATGSYTTYQWILNGAAIPGATNATHIATSGGVYSVTVTNAYGCEGTSVADTFVLSGISALNNYSAITLIPNPTNDVVYVKGTGNATIKVYNIVGQLLKEADNTGNISIADLPTGMYIFRLYNEQGILVCEEKIIRE